MQTIIHDLTPPAATVHAGSDSFPPSTPAELAIRLLEAGAPPERVVLQVMSARRIRYNDARDAVETAWVFLHRPE
jgi:hypothetical protein